MFDGRQPLRLAGRVVALDPLTLTAGAVTVGQLTGASMAASAVGTGITAASTIAGGAARQQEANYEAGQLRENAAADIAGSQRQMLQTQQQTRLLASRARAQAGANGTNAGVGSPAYDIGSINKQGSYQGMLDLFNGQNQATGDLNRAAGVVYSGNIAKQASTTSALATIAGGIGNETSIFGRFKFPMTYGTVR
jgi:hypothetical protein